MFLGRVVIRTLTKFIYSLFGFMKLIKQVVLMALSWVCEKASPPILLPKLMFLVKKEKKKNHTTCAVCLYVFFIPILLLHLPFIKKYWKTFLYSRKSQCAQSGGSGKKNCKECLILALPALLFYTLLWA